MQTQSEQGNPLFWSCACWVILCLVIAALSGWVSAHGVSTWYQHLVKPSFNPPKELFGPIWTTLYIMIGLAGGFIWQKKSHSKALISLFIIQLIFNFAWSFIFFSAHSVLWAFVDIMLLWLSIAALITVGFKKCLTAAWLLVPYFLWVSFALVLNYSLYTLN